MEGNQSGNGSDPQQTSVKAVGKVEKEYVVSLARDENPSANRRFHASHVQTGVVEHQYTSTVDDLDDDARSELSGLSEVSYCDKEKDEANGTQSGSRPEHIIFHEEALVLPYARPSLRKYHSEAHARESPPRPVLRRRRSRSLERYPIFEDHPLIVESEEEYSVSGSATPDIIVDDLDYYIETPVQIHPKSAHDIPEEQLRNLIGYLTHEENCLIPRCPCRDDKTRFQHLMPQVEQLAKEEADRQRG